MSDQDKDQAARGLVGLALALAGIVGAFLALAAAIMAALAWRLFRGF